MPKMTIQQKRDLQELMHYVGQEEFLKELQQLCYCASDDTEDFEDKSVSDGWRNLGTRLSDIMEE